MLSLTAAERTLIECAALAKCTRDLRPILVDCAGSQRGGSARHARRGRARSPNDIAVALETGRRLESLALIDTPIAEHNITDLCD